MSRSGGFTMVELTITVAVLAVLAGVAIPGFLKWKNEANLRGAVYTLRNDMQLARSRAIRDNTRVAVVFMINGYDMFVDDGAGGGTALDYIRNGDEEYLVRRRFQGLKIDLAGTTFGAAGKKTRFTGRGIPLAGRVTIGQGKSRRRMVVSFLGRMRLEQSRDGGATWF